MCARTLAGGCPSPPPKTVPFSGDFGPLLYTWFLGEYNNTLMLQYKVSLLLTDLVVAFVLFIFMLVYCCVFVSLPFLGEYRFI